MKVQKLKGFKDYLPEEMILRNHILNLLKETFEGFGYEPFDTPALEYTEVILGKSGKENDKLIYSFKDRGDRDISLRYDLTVPLARFISENKNIPKPFKRYQIGKVWRADKPQKGRYREFEQADIDVIGSDSFLIEIELILAFSKFLNKLNLQNYVIQINSREILQNALNTSGIKKEDWINCIQSIDKIDKIQEEGVILELEEKGFKNAKEIINNIKKSTPDLDLEKIIKILKNLMGNNHIVFDPFLARGHDYYTGIVFEITIPGLGYGSFAGGGRYDNLLENIGGDKIPACGISLGIDRFMDILKETKKEMFSKTVIDVSVIGFEEKDILEVFQFTNKLIDKNINCEIYSNYNKKLEKQLKFVNQKNVQFALIFQKEKILKDLKNRKEYIVKTPEDIFDIVFK